MANGINSSNTVVGNVNGGAFELTNNFSTLTMLPTANGITPTAAFGINDNGAIVGQYSSTGTLTPGYVYSGGTYTSLTPVAPVGGFEAVNAQGINNHGIVAGFYSRTAPPRRSTATSPSMVSSTTPPRASTRS